MTRRLLACTLAALACASPIAACGDDDGEQEAAATATATATEAATPEGASAEEITAAISKDTGTAPEIPKPGGDPPSELVAEDIVKGKGSKKLTADDTVLAHYTGVSWSTGKTFDSSWDRGEPAEFPLNQVIPGWTQGLEGMKEGGRRLLIIPPEMGYGETGSPPAIAPNETLVFVVDLVEIR